MPKTLKLGAQSWQFQAAKARFSELFRLARTEGQTRRRGTPLGMIEGLLAATAVHHNLTVVSRNAASFTIAQVAAVGGMITHVERPDTHSCSYNSTPVGGPLAAYNR